MNVHFRNEQAAQAEKSQVLEDRKRGQGSTEERKANQRLSISFVSITPLDIISS